MNNNYNIKQKKNIFFSEWLISLKDKIIHGDLGFIPVIIGLLCVVIIFYFANPIFLSPRNLSNLTLQIGVLGVMTLGVCLVLFLGEIDLSAGSVSGFCAVVMVFVSSKLGFGGVLAILTAISIGCLIGFIHGKWITFFGAPSFIVTLTGLLVWQGLHRMFMGNQIGQMLTHDPLVIGIASTFLPNWISIIILIIIILISYTFFFRELAFSNKTFYKILSSFCKYTIYPIIGVATFAVLSLYHGVPILLIILLTITLILTLLTEYTKFGVHIFAVGGNQEAARRTGVQVNKIRIIVFSICSGLAAISGIISVSRQFAVDTNTGGGNLILDAIAAAVIGGTSLFGGRGRIIGALLGALVIGSVANGLDLLGQSANVKSIITGLILLAAASIDIISRRRRILSGKGGA